MIWTERLIAVFREFEGYVVRCWPWWGMRKTGVGSFASLLSDRDLAYWLEVQAAMFEAMCDDALEAIPPL